MPITSTTRCSVRPAVIGDAARIAAMAREFNAYLGALGDKVAFKLDANRIRRDGFGPNPAICCIIRAMIATAPNVLS
jgi:hypothetical protein